MPDESKKPAGEGSTPLAFYALFFLLVWALVASFCQGGWSGFADFWTAYWLFAAVTIGITIFYNYFTEGPISFFSAAGFLLLAVWAWFASSWSDRLWDLGAALLALGATSLIFRLSTCRESRFPKGRAPALGSASAHADLLVFALLFWVFASVVTSVRSRPLPVHLERWAEIGSRRSILPGAAERWEPLRIGLALSGGGYRAAVYHAGVLQALEELGIRVDNLSTVSGGSIIGAYYAAGGDPESFVSAVEAGKFNLKRALLQFQNAIRLPLPMKLPWLETRLFPWCRFDRLDVQQKLLERLLFHDAKLPGSLEAGAPPLDGPLLMIAVTDLTYGFQLGLLPDGLLKLGHDGERDVYREDALKVFDDLNLAERVAISGAFPLAFPPRRLKIQVDPIEATGRGTRELLLADGGIRDNTGHDLLRAAAALSRRETTESSVADYLMPEDWNLDATMISDAGTIFGVLEQPASGLGLLPRSFDVAGVETDRSPLPENPCAMLSWPPPRFSPADFYLSPDSQFNLKNDTVRRAALDREFTVSFNPAWYPAEVLQRLVSLLPEPRGSEAKGKLNEFSKLWESHQVRGRKWSRAFTQASRESACRTTEDPASSAKPALVPGVCEAIALRQILIEAITLDLETFRATSTLDDTPPPETVRALERLGKIIVYLRWPTLASHLDRTLFCKDQRSELTEPASAEIGELPQPMERSDEQGELE